MNKLPLVSVLLPVYRVEKYIGECIDSILEQNYPNLEIIFVDDHSPDKSSAIIERRMPEMEQRGWSVQLFNQVNKGLASARNTALKYAKGDYVCFLDSDDLLPSTAIEELVKAAVKSDADIVRGDIVRFSENSETPFSRRFPTDIMEFRFALLDWGKYPLGVCGGIYRRPLFVDNDLWFYDGLNFGEDFGMTSRLAYYAKNIATVDAVAYKYRINPSSLTQVYKERNAQDLFEISDKIKAFYESKADYLDYKDALMRGRARIKTITLLQLSPELSAKYADSFPDLKDYKKLPLSLKLKLRAMEHNYRTAFKILNKIRSWRK